MQRSMNGYVSEHSFTYYLKRWQKGDQQACRRLFEIILKEIRQMAARELNRRGGQLTWQKTELANEIVLRLLKHKDKAWKDKKHFLNTAALAMFQILIDYGRNKSRRINGQKRVEMEMIEERDFDSPNLPAFSHHDRDRLIDLQKAISKLKGTNKRWAKIAVMKLSLGMRTTEIANHLGIAESTVNNQWSHCKKFLSKELSHWRQIN